MCHLPIEISTVLSVNDLSSLLLTQNLDVCIKYFKNIFINYIHVKKYIKENIYL